MARTTTEIDAELSGLIEIARQARAQALAPYSRFPVGAAIRTHSSQVYRGCNVENSAYGASMCAERIAIFNAVAAGERRFHAMALVADLPAPLKPCGMCRQVLAELAPGLILVMANLAGEVLVVTIDDLLPAPFVLPQRQALP